jgi:hypothetical protein
MKPLRIAFDALPVGRWGPLLHVLRLEHLQGGQPRRASEGGARLHAQRQRVEWDNAAGPVCRGDDDRAEEVAPTSARTRTAPASSKRQTARPASRSVRASRGAAAGGVPVRSFAHFPRAHPALSVRSVGASCLRQRVWAVGSQDQTVALRAQQRRAHRGHREPAQPHVVGTDRRRQSAQHPAMARRRNAAGRVLVGRLGALDGRSRRAPHHAATDRQPPPPRADRRPRRIRPRLIAGRHEARPDSSGALRGLLKAGPRQGSVRGRM